MRILSFSSCFPNLVDPTAGVFVFRRLKALAAHVSLEVANPTPWFPGYDGLRHPGVALPDQEMREALIVYHPRFFYLPRILKRWDARFYDRGLRAWVRHYCRQHSPALFDAHFSWPDGVAVSYLARRLGIPYTITLRGVIIPRYKIECFGSRFIDALTHAAAVISVDRRMADIARELGVAPERVHVIGNGVDATFFEMVPRCEARARVGLPEDGQVIVSVGSLEPRKAHESVIEAVAGLNGPVRLIIIGKEIDDGSRLKMLRQLAADRGLADRVAFTGRQPPETVATYLNAADISVLASLWEGCPNAVIESLACGTPVVATEVGAVPDLVRPGETGEIVPVGNTGALHAALARALRREWSREAVRQSIAGRSWDTVAREVLAVFESVLGHK